MGMLMMAIANMALVRPGPSTLTIAMASKRNGNASTTSRMRMMMLSLAPPLNPAIAPSSVPTMTAKPTVTNADHERNTGAVDDTAKLVADITVQAHNVLRLVFRAPQQVNTRRLAFANIFHADQHLLRIVGSNQWGEDGRQNKQADEYHANNG